MASHATGFTLPTIRRCGERMEAVPFCTVSTGSISTEEDICNLSWIFSEEPWCIAQRTKGRTSTTTRKRQKKRTTPSPSLSDIEVDPEDSVDEQTIEADLDLLNKIENEDGVPKRRRSERIRNQRRAKLLSRLKAINAIGKLKSPPKETDGKNKLVSIDKCNTITADSNSQEENRNGATFVEEQSPTELEQLLAVRLFVRKKRLRRTRSTDSSNSNCGRDFCAKRSKSVTEGVVDMRGSVFVDLHGNRKVLKKPTEGVNLPADADVEVVPKKPNASTLIPVVSL